MNPEQQQARSALTAKARVEAEAPPQDDSAAADRPVSPEQPADVGVPAVRDNGEMPFHPATGLFPLLEGPDSESFRADLQANGQLVPVETYDGQILDSRNRYRAGGPDELALSKALAHALATCLGCEAACRILEAAGAEVRRIQDRQAADGRRRPSSRAGKRAAGRAKAKGAAVAKPPEKGGEAP
jgi:hypothetical protein